MIIIISHDKRFEQLEAETIYIQEERKMSNSLKKILHTTMLLLCMLLCFPISYQLYKLISSHATLILTFHYVYNIIMVVTLGMIVICFNSIQAETDCQKLINKNRNIRNILYINVVVELFSGIIQKETGLFEIFNIKITYLLLLDIALLLYFQGQIDKLKNEL